MPSRRRTPSRSTALALVILAATPLLACHRAEQRPAAAATAPPPAAPAPPTTPAPLGRAQIIAAAASASEAAAVARPFPPELAKLVGSRFEVKLPFGCAGEAPDMAVGYRVDAGRGTLTLRAQPERWTDTAWVRGLAGPAPLEAIEGFWLRRPWISTDACPAIRAPAGPVPPPAPETLGLARLFAPGASRLLRHGEKGYEVVRKAKPGELRLQGFRLVLAGRIADFGGGQPIRCRSDGPDQRPVCLVAVEFDRVTFEDPVSGEVLAEWRS